MKKITKKLKLHRLIAWLLAIAMLSGYVPQGVSLKGLDVFRNMGKVQAAATLQNPRIVKDSSMDAGQRVTWDCVWFGSYPQSEVTEKDGNIYNILKNATGWDSNNDITLGNTKYRRLKGEDATYSTSFSSGYYNWNNDYNTYHYFKYEPIKWRVLSVDGNDAFLLADVALDDQRYNLNYESVTWESSGIRSWLNGYGASANEPQTDYSYKNFLNTAFSPEEKNAVKTTNVINDKNNSTSDKVFLLLYATAAKYGFTKTYSIYDEARRSRCSTYAHAMGTYRYNYASASAKKYNGNICWWLCSPNSTYHAAGVLDDGWIDWGLNRVDCICYGVRPALHLNLSATKPLLLRRNRLLRRHGRENLHRILPHRRLQRLHRHLRQSVRND